MNVESPFFILFPFKWWYVPACKGLSGVQIVTALEVQSQILWDSEGVPAIQGSHQPPGRWERGWSNWVTCHAVEPPCMTRAAVKRWMTPRE